MRLYWFSTASKIQDRFTWKKVQSVVFGCPDGVGLEAKSVALGFPLTEGERVGVWVLSNHFAAYGVVKIVQNFHV